MTPVDQELEAAIARRGEDVLAYQRMADQSTSSIERGQWRDEARRAAHDVAALVARRAPQTVARLERERGLV